MAEETDLLEVNVDHLSEDLLQRISFVYQLLDNWADFHMYIVNPTFPAITPPNIIPPEKLANGEKEFVYVIHDYGYRLSTSKNEDMFTAGQSMCKLHLTIEKMVALLIKRLKDGGVDETTEVQVAIEGHTSAKRKAFEIIINLDYNVIIPNFDPGEWGERYLKIVKILSEKGYGYPPKSPRDSYRRGGSSTKTSARR